MRQATSNHSCTSWWVALGPDRTALGWAPARSIRLAMEVIRPPLHGVPIASAQEGVSCDQRRHRPPKLHGRVAHM
eukprot:7211170-Pyramimonas_sp.AAC.1